jgi:hypothetical protein
MLSAPRLRSVVLLASLLVPSVALADEEPPPLPPPAPSAPAPAAPASGSATIDNVHLRNGGLYRGHVTEIVPGDHVTIVVEKGETKRIPWPEVDRVIVSSAAVPPPPPSPGGAAPATPPLAAPMVGPRARVHITTSRTVILYRKPAGSNAWSQACTSPCNEELPIGDTYRLTGNGVGGTKEFHLEASPGGTVDVAVDPANTGGMIIGGAMAGAGVVTGYVGLLVAAIGAGRNAKDCDFVNSCNSSKDGDDMVAGGLIAMGIGAALTIGGILVFVSSAKTDVTQSSAGRGETAFRREPMWTARTASAPAATFPVLYEGRF